MHFIGARFTRLLTTIGFVASVALAGPAAAARLSFIRDAEVESIIHGYAAPLFTAAGLDPAAVHLYLVNDRRLNAFVAGGMNLFINTGLLVAAQSANQVIGVIAHETGHIHEGHLARTPDELRGASVASILATILAAAAAVAGGGAGAAAIIAGGRGLAVQTYLSHSRGQEEAADQYAAVVLDLTHQSSRGLMEFLQTLARRDPLAAANQSPYLRTHPLTVNRISFLEHHVATSPYSDLKEPPEVIRTFARMQAKLHGFLDEPRDVFRLYPADDTSVAARYARCIAHFRRAELAPALAGIDSLIAEAPDDPYFHELKGQFLFENGRIAKAVVSYRRASELLPDEPLIQIGLAQALVETGDTSVLDEAGKHLDAALRREPDNARAWRLLAVVHGRKGEFGLSALASAEFSLAVGRFDDAISFAKQAQDRLPFGAPGRLRAEDIEQAAKRAAHRGDEG